MKTGSARQRHRTGPPRQASTFSALAFCVPLLLGAKAQASDAGQRFIEIDAGYRSGDFASTTRSKLSYVGGVLGYIAPNYHLSVSVPYLSLREETGALNTSSSGVGDVVLQAGHTLMPDQGSGTSLYGTLGIKVPTANEARGLGTGETDYGGFLTLSRRWHSATLTLMAGYTFIGDPPSVNYNDSYLYGFGISQQHGNTLAYVSLEGRRAILPGDSNPLELYAGFYHPVGKHYTLKGSAFLGLSDGSPDYGMEIGGLYWF